MPAERRDPAATPHHSGDGGNRRNVTAELTKAVHAFTVQAGEPSALPLSAERKSDT
jgi:hypothetical protein